MRSSSSARSPEHQATPPRRRTLMLLLALTVICATQIVFLLVTLIDPARLMLGVERDPTSALVLQLFTLAGSCVTLFRVVLVARYRPSPDVEDVRLPMLTVVVPAYNEGRQVLSTLRSLAASRYPRERLQLIAVDDGSQDDTWMWIRRGEHELGSLLTAVRCPRNGGKRHALYEGFRRAKGKIVITVDSDSEVLPDTLHRMVSPFLHDPECGAVAGNVRVLNRHQGALPKMLDAAFTAAFDFQRAGESELGAVMCTPGALSAYRMDLLMPVLDEWRSQTFFGRPAAIGEDRAMTNLLLRGGATVRYQSNAIVLTQVPVRAKVLCKMFLRWGRSNVRESLVMAKFIFRNRTVSGGSRRGIRVLFVASVVQMLMSAAMFVPGLLLLAKHPTAVPFILSLGVLGSLPVAAITLAARDAATAVWALPWGVYSLVVTGWITPWSLLTSDESGWLTRGPVQADSSNVVPLPARSRRETSAQVASAPTSRVG